MVGMNDSVEVDLDKSTAGLLVIITDFRVDNFLIRLTDANSVVVIGSVVVVVVAVVVVVVDVVVHGVVASNTFDIGSVGPCSLNGDTSSPMV